MNEKLKILKQASYKYLLIQLNFHEPALVTAQEISFTQSAKVRSK